MKLMKKGLIALIVFTAVFSMTAAMAVKVTHLYQAELSVAAQTEDLKERAAQAGFAQVLKRLTGNADIEKNSLLKEGLKKAGYYVKEFRYLLPTAASSQYTVQIYYDMADVNRLLQKAGVARWNENRPL